ncbi:MAG: hypothetical protein SchgKO_23630 [Schleiferiaceae bacterium]
MALSPKEKEFVQEIGKTIVAIRHEKGLKQKQLADILEIEDSSLRRIESGRTNPTAATLYRIAQALEVEVNELVLEYGKAVNSEQ